MNRQRIWLGLAVVVVALVAVTVAAAQSRNAGATAVSCESGTALSNPADNPGLVSDCETLLAAKDALRGTETLNWSADQAIASWEGITVGGSPRRVTKLVLESGSLNGTIPAGLGDLSALTELRLGWNQLTGSIPPELGQLTRLTYIGLPGNRLSGTIPPELGSIGSTLTRLNLSGPTPLPDGVGLTGSIPPELGYLGGLESLYLDGNRLTGTIPTRLGRLTNLRLLHLARNQLSGAVPTQLGNLTALRELRLESNSLSGAVPTQLDNLSNLRKAYLKNNSGFTGCVTRDLSEVRRNDVASLNLPFCAADAPATPMTPLPTHTLTVTVTGSGSVAPAGASTHDEGSAVTLTATWDDSMHYFESWGGACSDTEGTTCTLSPFDYDATVSATFAERCTAGATDPTCIRVVYMGAPDDYAAVSDVPADVTLTPNSEGRYEVGRGEQITVVTGGASLPEGYTRFYLHPSQLTTDPSPFSDESLILPAGTTYTLTVDSDAASGELATFDLAPGNAPQTPDTDPVLGAAAVTSTFEVLHVPDLILISHGSYDALTLEWTRGPTSTTGWQYRVRTWTNGAPDAWGSWTDVPDSTATTRTHRLTGLLVRRAYDTQVRALVPRVQVVESNVADGATQYSDGTAPSIGPGDLVEGDGQTRWRVHFLPWTVVIPDGMRVRGGGGWMAEDGTGGVTIFDAASGSALRFGDYGEEHSRELAPDRAPSAPSGASRASRQSQTVASTPGSRFNQIVESVQRRDASPPPGDTVATLPALGAGTVFAASGPPEDDPEPTPEPQPEVVENVPTLIHHYVQNDDESDEAVRSDMTDDNSPGGEGYRLGVPAIVRNLVTSEQPMTVCTDVDDDLRALAVKGADLWNDGLDLGRDLLTVVAGPCDTDALTTKTLQGIASIRVSEFGTSPATCSGSCWQPTYISGGPYYTYRGQAQVMLRLNEADDDASKILIIAHELGHALGLAHPWDRVMQRTPDPTGQRVHDQFPIKGCAGSFYVHETRTETMPDQSFVELVQADFERLTAVNAGAATIGGAIMNSTYKCRGDDSYTVTHPSGNTVPRWRWSSDGRAIQPYDKAAFMAAYKPTAVTSPSVRDVAPSGEVRVSWDADDVRTESEFVVEVRVRYSDGGLGWKRVSRAPANAESVEFTKPTSGTGYTIVGRSSTTTQKGAHAIYRVVTGTRLYGLTTPVSKIVSSSSVEHERPLLTLQEVCVEWGWYLRWQNTVLNENRNIRVTGYTSYATAHAVYAGSRQIISTGGGVAPPFPILGGGVFCSQTAFYPAATSETSVRSDGGGGGSGAGQLDESASLQLDEGGGRTAQVDAALATLEACVASATTAAELSACTTAFAAAVGDDGGVEV